MRACGTGHDRPTIFKRGRNTYDKKERNPDTLYKRKLLRLQSRREVIFRMFVESRSPLPSSPKREKGRLRRYSQRWLPPRVGSKKTAEFFRRFFKESGLFFFGRTRSLLGFLRFLRFLGLCLLGSHGTLAARFATLVAGRDQLD